MISSHAVGCTIYNIPYINEIKTFNFVLIVLEFHLCSLISGLSFYLLPIVDV